MRLLLLAVMASLVSSSAFPQTAATVAPAPVDIVKLEQNLWTTIAEGDFATVRSLFTPDFIQVGDHIEALDNLLITIKHCKLESYELRDLQVRILTPDSAMTAYHVVNTFDCGTPEKPKLQNNDNNAVTVWVRRPNSKKWLAQAHTETPVKP
jgi:uncharacterized protein (TIGR02246 family)